MPQSSLLLLAAAATLATSCGESIPAPSGDDGGDPLQSGDEAAGDPAGDASGDAGGDGDCAVGRWCNPISIAGFPFVDARDTNDAPDALVDDYGCAAAIKEWGGEWVYQVTLTERSLLRAEVDDVAGDGVDVDLHLLTSRNPNDCVTRANVRFGQLLEAGTYYLAVDTWTSDTGQSFPGPYVLTVDSLALESGACAVQASDLEMVWSTCDATLDCYEANDPGSGSLERYLRTPTVGPVVMEAHLVTDQESFGGGWPTAATDGLSAHYSLSEAATGYVTTRTEPWAPFGEGGSEWGQGSTGAKLPVLAEAWYVNMYWRNRPAAGTRLLVIHPLTGEVVVAAGGYETGPGSNTAIGGAVEEIHHWLGTGHRDHLIFGFAVDQGLPLGPYDCATGSAIAP